MPPVRPKILGCRMNKENSTFEEEIEKHGYLVYGNVGDSMLPLLRQGKDLFVISRKPEGRLKKYDVPLYKRDDGTYVLHRIIKVRRHDYVLCGDNRWQCEKGISDRHVIGVMTAIVRDGTSISVTDGKYRLYVHLWCDFFLVRAFILRFRALLRKIKRSTVHKP